MALISWCRQTVAWGLQKALKPLTIQCRFESKAPTIQYEEPFTRRWGYYNRWARRGLLAHNDEFARVSVLPIYRPKDSWTQKKALFGQNDYIDILGNGEVSPVSTHYNVPRWLRGFGGDELSVLIRRRKYLSKRGYPSHFPQRWHSLNKRIKFLYRFMNHKTRSPLLTRKKTD